MRNPPASRLPVSVDLRGLQVENFSISLDNLVSFCAYTANDALALIGVFLNIPITLRASAQNTCHGDGTDIVHTSEHIALNC